MPMPRVNVGDVIVTSGLGGSYARGLIIGTVVKVDAQQGDTSRRIVVSPERFHRHARGRAGGFQRGRIR